MYCPSRILSAVLSQHSSPFHGLETISCSLAKTVAFGLFVERRGCAFLVEGITDQELFLDEFLERL